MANSKMISNQEQTPNIQRKELTDYNILKAIESNSSVSQRGLSSQMQINVASVNFALKRLIKKGFIRMVGINPRRIKYFVTPEGVREKTQLAYRFFGRNLHFYKEVRSDIESRIAEATNATSTSVAIYGIGELSEIAYMAVSVMNVNFVGFFYDGSGDKGLHGLRWIGILTGIGVVLWTLASWDDWIGYGGFSFWFQDYFWSLVILGGLIGIIYWAIGGSKGKPHKPSAAGAKE